MTGRFYLSIRPVCDCCYPVKITRRGRTTVQFVDPTARRVDIIRSAMNQMHEWEHEASRAGYGQPPVGLPLDDGLMEGTCLLYVPPALRLPGEPAIQGASPELIAHGGPQIRAAYAEALQWERAELRSARSVA